MKHSFGNCIYNFAYLASDFSPVTLGVGAVFSDRTSKTIVVLLTCAGIHILAIFFNWAYFC